MSLELKKLNSFNSNRLTSAKQSPLVRGILLLFCSFSVGGIAASYALPKSDLEQKPNQSSAIAPEDRSPYQKPQTLRKRSE